MEVDVICHTPDCFLLFFSFGLPGSITNSRAWCFGRRGLSLLVSRVFGLSPRIDRHAATGLGSSYIYRIRLKKSNARPSLPVTCRSTSNFSPHLLSLKKSSYLFTENFTTTLSILHSTWPNSSRNHQLNPTPLYTMNQSSF